MARPIKRKKRGKRRAQELSSAELAALLQVTVRQVRRWTGKGCPSTRARGGRGRPAHRFKLIEVKAWLIAQGIAPAEAPREREPAAKVAPTATQAVETAEPDAPAEAGAATGMDAPAPAGGGADVAGAGPLRELGYAGLVARLRYAELQTWAAWVRTVREQSNVAEIAARARLWQENTEALRKAEKDEAVIRSRQEDWIPREEAEQTVARAATEIKMGLLAIPRSLASRLVGQGAPQIEALITREIEACLSRVASGSG